MKALAQIATLLFIGAGMLFPPTATASPAAPVISVSPASAAPGALVQIKGSGYNPNAVPRVHWDSSSAQSPFLAQGQINPDGTFVINVAVPPDAVSGPHTWWLVSTLRAGGTETASAPFTVVFPSHAAAFIYDQDLTQAQQYQALLQARGVHITLLSLSTITSVTVFAPYELIVIGYDTGNLTTWGTTAQQSAVALSGKPVLGIGVGGYTFFGKINSPIGYPIGAQVTGVYTVAAVNTADPIFNTPYKIPLTNSQVKVYASPAAPFEIPVPQPSSQVYPLGALPGTSTQMDVIQSGRYLLWGFGAGPTYLTSDGLKLFANTVYYLLAACRREKPDWARNGHRHRFQAFI